MSSPTDANMGRVGSATDAPMGRTYALVFFCHACVITALWLLGRAFSG